MKRIIGVHYWEKKIHLCWAEEESISTASFNLPQDLRKDDLLKQEFLYLRIQGASYSRLSKIFINI